MEFVNRYNELAKLEEEYKRNGSSFTVVYGRRRLGKTTLINKFLERHPGSVYYMADKEHEVFQINKFRILLAEKYNDSFMGEITFQSWDQLFDYYIQKTDFKKKTILAIDEFQYLPMVNPAFTSVFQRIWDEKLKQKNIMLILCGSHTSMMYSTTLDYSSPLYGRRTSQMKLSPILFSHWNGFFPKNTDPVKLVGYYAIASGIPKYIEMLDRKNIFADIEKYFCDKDGFFYHEPRFLLMQELNDITNYFSIIRVISQGEHKLGNIAAKMNQGTSKITQYLDILRDLEIIERRVPVTEKNPEKSRRGLYFVKDYFIRFWFRYIYPYQSFLEMGNTGWVMQKIKEDFNTFTGPVFEDICQQLLPRFSPFVYQKCGSHWDNNSEIDIAAYNEDTGESLFGECKWTNEKTGMKTALDLIGKSKKLEWHRDSSKQYYILFSKNGFDKSLEKYAKENKNIILVDFSKKITFDERK